VEPNKSQPDAPIVHLLSLNSQPLIKDMPLEELVAHLEKVRALTQSPARMTSILTSEATVARTRLSPASATKRAKLDSL